MAQAHYNIVYLIVEKTGVCVDKSMQVSLRLSSGSEHYGNVTTVQSLLLTAVLFTHFKQKDLVLSSSVAYVNWSKKPEHPGECKYFEQERQGQQIVDNSC